MPALRRTSLALATVVLVAVAGSLVAAAAPAADRKALIERMQKYRETTWRLQRLMGKRLTRTPRALKGARTFEAARYGVRYWRRQMRKARRQVRRPPHREAWLCIHRYEGPWNANTGNGYYGGLQMDIRFQRTYGRDLLRREGRAHNWSPLEQMWVAERALRAGRGFYPWPTAARLCGLI